MSQIEFCYQKKSGLAAQDARLELLADEQSTELLSDVHEFTLFQAVNCLLKELYRD